MPIGLGREAAFAELIAAADPDSAVRRFNEGIRMKCVAVSDFKRAALGAKKIDAGEEDIIAADHGARRNEHGMRIVEDVASLREVNQLTNGQQFLLASDFVERRQIAA